jgi:hypothetical protein
MAGMFAVKRNTSCLQLYVLGDSRDGVRILGRPVRTLPLNRLTYPAAPSRISRIYCKPPTFYAIQQILVPVVSGNRKKKWNSSNTLNWRRRVRNLIAIRRTVEIQNIEKDKNAIMLRYLMGRTCNIRKSEKFTESTEQVHSNFPQRL